MKSQDKTSNPLLLQTWKLKKLDTFIYTYEKQDSFDKKTPGIKFQKNGKVVGNLSISAFGDEMTESSRNLKYERYIGDWKRVSDTTISILFPFNSNMTGSFVITKLTANELKLKKVFDAATEKKLDSIRRMKDISYE